MNVVGILISYWYFKRQNTLEEVKQGIQACLKKQETPSIIIDSGAFSADTQNAHITIKEYAEWLERQANPTLAPHITGTINLDVLRNPTASLHNWTQLKNYGINTMPVIHLGDPPETMNPYIEAGADYIGLGAMVGRDRTRKIRWAAHMMKYTHKHHPHVRFHGLGIGSQQLVEALPWYTVDSSGFGRGYRYAKMGVFDPRTKTFIELNLRDQRNLHQHGNLLRRTYNTDPTSININGRRTSRQLRDTIIALTRDSIIKWQAHLRQKQPVTPPQSARLPGPIIHAVPGTGANDVLTTLAGPIVHYVDGVSRNSSLFLAGDKP